MNGLLSRALAVLVVIFIGFAHTSALGLQITIAYTDDEGEGFKNANNGAQRKAAFEQAVSMWENHLVGNVELIVEAQFNDLDDNTNGITEIPQRGQIIQAIPNSSSGLSRRRLARFGALVCRQVPDYPTKVLTCS